MFNACICLPIPREAPESDALNPSLDSAFWVWNLVSNLAYGDRADIVSKALEAKLLPMQERLMAAAAKEDDAAVRPGVKKSTLMRFNFIHKVRSASFLQQLYNTVMCHG